MAQKMTEIVAAGHGWMEYGHLDRQEAISRATRFFRGQLVDACEALIAIAHEDVKVFHQENIHAVKNRREVK